MLFRNSMLINSLLSSSESLYHVEKKHIDKLESCDKDLMVRLFSVPHTCSYESIYLETGCTPIRFIIQGRRLMYFWTLLNKSNNELVKKVFATQKQFPSKNDWILTVKEDLQMLDLDLSEETIMKMKKQTFKKIIKQKLKEKSTEFLFNLKLKENRSKSKKLNTFNFQEYLLTDRLNTRQKKLLFSMRTRSVDVKTNYKSMHTFNMLCRLCKKEEDSEKHYLECEEIIKNIDHSIDLTQANYENIFSSNIDDQIVITKIFDQVFKTRNKLLHK